MVDRLRGVCPQPRCRAVRRQAALRCPHK
jgi:hypothetical protein